ncbi:MAG: CinA family nicotinamide mononucleotide deamidase-related protein [Chloroflexi bacterium]|nr:CinA family nicotinamide mononucleotide deamidase-related protein [Chloroflexota bacterium]MCC6891334.1 CinA family nicotinamide mononucleotide deamidase-related protein [Anaerolineae bacterium]
MAASVNAEIIAIGTEILLGEITDTNSVFIAKLLRDIGVNLYFMTSVGDNEQRIADSIRIAMGRAQVVITCGGLGPTIDDMTRQGVATATDRGLVFHQYLLDAIAERFTGFRAKMTENNKRQAYLPADSTVIENPVGTAPSFIVEHQGSVVISLPGVPREMKFLMNERVIPYLKEKYQLGSGIIKAKVLRTAGIGESLLDSEIGTELLEMANPTVGLAAHAGQVDVRITAKAGDVATADQMIALVEEQIRAKVGKFIFGIDQEEIETVLTRVLRASNLRVALSETGITGLLSERIRKVAGADGVLSAATIYAEPTALQNELDISGELPIRELAEKAATQLTRNANADAGIAVVCRPDMGEQHADSEAGTAIAVYYSGVMRSRVYGFGGQSETAPQWASTWAMSMLWQMLQETLNS